MASSEGAGCVVYLHQVSRARGRQGGGYPGDLFQVRALSWS